ncbi:Hypothetical predicted protein [Pelobates cultripes]|uniref:Uncharacterized protein n=1 Tax=Pelobates cultripes TaxID=61616 RepID=A0AAD1SAD7_PELCU|nr:Hypothetical predicted protein [Pelobates cultripes]
MTTQLTLHLWDEIRKREGNEGTLLGDAPILCIAVGIPTFDTQKWNEAGCTKIKHMYHEGNLLPFPDLQARNDIPNKALFSYLQLKPLLTGVQINNQVTPNKHSIEQLCLTDPLRKQSPRSTTYSQMTRQIQTLHSKQLGTKNWDKS